MKWKATQDEAGEEAGKEEPISTTQTDFLAFSGLLLGYFETYPSKHSCIHSYFIPPPSPSALTLFFDQRKEVRSQQEGSLPAKTEKGSQSVNVQYTLLYGPLQLQSQKVKIKNRIKWIHVLKMHKSTLEIHNPPESERSINSHIWTRTFFSGHVRPTTTWYKMHLIINTNSISRRTEELTISAKLEIADWSLC